MPRTTKIIESGPLEQLKSGFSSVFSKQPRYFYSAPGRTEICGNHTDHQQGRVLAAAVNLDALAAVRENGSNEIRVKSEGYDLCIVALNDLAPHPGEENTTLSLVRGVAARMQALGGCLRGIDIYIMSDVLPGSGLSSSAAFEVLLGTIFSDLFFSCPLSPMEIAQAAQYAENVYFGKPCGLMDQMASAVGNLVEIDFFDAEHPVVMPIDFNFSAAGHALCIIDSGASHADLTDEYAAIPMELKEICAHFGKRVLTEIDEKDFYAAIPALRKTCGDRAVLRAVHFYQENQRVPQAAQALRQGDFDRFLSIIRQSGRSSFMYLQNVSPAGAVRQQDMAITLALCEKYLEGAGACRVHGGGFAGTCQAFVPYEKLDAFKAGIEAVLGVGACHVLSIRPQGGVRLEVEP